jgi:hypothetical protein
MGRRRLVEGAAASAAPAEWLVNLAMIDAATGATEEARRLVSELARDGGSALTMNVNWHAACVLADAAVVVGDREAGATLYGLLEPHARLFPLIARAVACLGSAEYYVGCLAGLLGRHDEAEARLRRAVDENERAGAGPAVVAALLRLGETLADRGRPHAARDIVVRAAERAGLRSTCGPRPPTPVDCSARSAPDPNVGGPSAPPAQFAQERRSSGEGPGGRRDVRGRRARPDAGRRVRVRDRPLPGRGRVRVRGELPLLALSRVDRVGVQAVRRDPPGAPRGHRRGGLVVPGRRRGRT